MRSLALIGLLVACSACSVHRRIDEVTDEEIHSKHLWTEKDQEARALLESEPAPAFGTAADPERPIRRPSIARKFVDVIDVDGVEIPIPQPTRAVEWLLGLRWDPQYYYLKGSKAYVILRRDGPPVVVEEGGGDDGGWQLPGKTNSVPSRELEEAEKLGPRIELPRPDRPTKSAAAP